jgi:hypothetical protein
VIATVPMASEFDAPKPAEARLNLEVPEKAKQRRFSATYKLKFLAEYEGLDRAGKGALLRPEGVPLTHLSHLSREAQPGTRPGG